MSAVEITLAPILGLLMQLLLQALARAVVIAALTAFTMCLVIRHWVEGTTYLSWQEAIMIADCC